MLDAPAFLRKLSSLIDDASRNSSSSDNNQTVDTQTDAESTDSTSVMVPPLQQQIELLKKLSGVDSVFDEKTEKDDTEVQEIGNDANHEDTTETDELDTLRKNAGLALVLTNPIPGE